MLENFRSDIRLPRLVKIEMRSLIWPSASHSIKRRSSTPNTIAVDHGSGGSMNYSLYIEGLHDI